MDLAHLINEFLTEAQEHIATAEEDVLALEHVGMAEGQETLHRLFRALHTIKGGAACVNFDGIKELAHEMENVAGRLRDGTLDPTPEIAQALLGGVDKLKAAILSGTGSIDHPEQILSRLRSIAPTSQRSNLPSSVNPVAGRSASANFDLHKFDTRELREQGMHVYDITLDAATECLRLGCAPAALLETLGSIGSVLASKPDASAFTASPGAITTCSFLLASIIDDPEILFPGLQIEPTAFIHYPPSDLTDSVETHAVPAAPSAPETTPSPSQALPHAPEKLLRIPVEIADKLMNLAGELVVVRNRSHQLQDSGNTSEISAMNQRLDVVTSDIQRMVMRTRMQPVGNVFGRFSRVVRDLGRSLGKEIDLQITGADVELDKSIIDGLVEPLTHLVRNSADHGIETPEERRKSGKPVVGRIRLVAEHQAGLVNILVVDDGKGIDPQKMRDTVVEKGLMPQHQANALSDREALELIFLPGFSTAKQVTEVSGRGVGMDVVRASLQKLGGVVEIESNLGKGSTISIRLPLTLAIIPAIILAAEDQCFAVPQVSVLEVVWLHGEQVYQSIQKIDECEVYWLRGKMLPLIRLSKVLRLRPTYVDPVSREQESDRRSPGPDRRQKQGEAFDDVRSGVVDRRVSADNSLYIIVLRVGSDRFGLCVERIVDTEEIVVKPLHERLKASRVYAGVTVLGDGTTSLIIDVPELARAGGVRCEKTDTLASTPRSKLGEEQNMLVFTNGIERFAVPLSILKRVDEIRPGDIQVAAGQEFLRFRDSVIPLVRIESVIASLESRYNENNLHAIIPRMGNPLAILIGDIADIVRIDNDALVLSKGHPAVIGTQVIDGHATTVLDLCALVAAANPSENAPGHPSDDHPKCLLLVEDSTLFLALIASFLRGLGFEVVTAGNGREAVELLDRVRVDGIVSDIEMPEMDGLDLARHLKAHPEFCGIPMLAISTIEEKIMRSRSMDAGFDDFCPKSNLPQLGKVIQGMVSNSAARPAHA